MSSFIVTSQTVIAALQQTMKTNEKTFQFQHSSINQWTVGPGNAAHASSRL